MPMLTPLERCQLMMRTLNKEAMTADHLAKTLDIPVATIRKTLSRDYPYCFSRDSENYRLITLSGLNPDGIQFDLDPEATTKRQHEKESLALKRLKLKAEHLKRVDATQAAPLSRSAWDMINRFIKGGYPTDKTERSTFWELYNALRWYVLCMDMLVVRDNPGILLYEVVDVPKDLNDQQYGVLEHITSKWLERENKSA